MQLRSRPVLVGLMALVFTALLASQAGAAMFRDIDTIGTRISDGGEITGEFNLIGERGENDSILIGAPYARPPRLVNDILGFPAGVGVELDYARVRFFVRNGDRGEEVEMEVELLGREIGDVEFEGRFEVFSKRLNGRLRGKISETGIATYVLEIEGRAIVDYAMLTVGTRPGTGGAVPAPEPSSALLYLAGLVTLRQGLRRRASS